MSLFLRILQDVIRSPGIRVKEKKKHIEEQYLQISWFCFLMGTYVGINVWRTGSTHKYMTASGQSESSKVGARRNFQVLL